jgi:hypothetical protein
MPDDKPIDLEFPDDFGKPAAPPGLPSPEELPEAVPVVSRPVRPAPVPWAAPTQVRRVEPPAKKQTLLAMVVVFGLMAATLAAVLLLMVAIYAGFQAFGVPGVPPKTPNARDGR